MARVDFRPDFLDLTKQEELIIEGLLSIYELFYREPFFKRFSFRTHRINEIDRLSFYHKAIKTVTEKGSFSRGFVKVAQEASKILDRKYKN